MPAELKFSLGSFDFRAAFSLPVFMIWNSNGTHIGGIFVHFYKDLIYTHSNTLSASLLVTGLFLNGVTDSVQIPASVLDMVYVHRLGDDLDLRAGFGLSPLSLLVGVADVRASLGMGYQF